MELKQIYKPIERELTDVEQILNTSLKNTRHKPILEVTNYLLEAKGKRMRPALVILCAKAANLKHNAQSLRQLTKVASAIELVHTASLIHDDVLDRASIRHNKPTVNIKWGDDVSVALGDYLYSEAFKLISECESPDVIRCISSATKSMCEGELLQVCERDNLDLLKEHYLIMIKRKTAELFAASCQAGALLLSDSRIIQNALKGYGLNFGIAFQIMDDCMDLIGKKYELGKSPGADFNLSELTLPVLNLIQAAKDKGRIISLLRQPDSKKAFRCLRQEFINSKAFVKTKKDINSYIAKAKASLSRFNNSCFKQSLCILADYIGDKITL